MSNDITPTTSVPLEYDLLSTMAHVQSQAPALLWAASKASSQGDLSEARRLNQELIRVQSEHLRLALLYNAHYSGPFDISPIAQPLVNALLTQADTLESLGLLKEAEAHRAQAVAVAQEHLSAVGQAEVERSRAMTLLAQARFNEALTALSSTRDLFDLAGDTVQMAKVTVSLVDVLQWLGDHERALVELERATHAIAKKSARFQKKGNGWADLVLAGLTWLEEKVTLDTVRLDVEFYGALIRKALGDLTTAEVLFRKLLPQYQKPLLNTGAAIEFYLTAILVDQGLHVEGLAYTNRLEPIFLQDKRLRPKLATLWLKQAEALLGLARPTEALSKLDAGIAELTRFPNPDTLWRLHWRRGQILAILGDPAAALAAYSDAIGVINRLRRAPLGYRLDSLYLQDKLRVFATAIALTCQSDAAEIGCRFIELIKSRTLTAVLSIPKTATMLEPVELHAQVDSLTRQLDAIEYRMYQDGATAELRAQQDRLQQERSNLLERIRFSDLRWRTLTEPVAFHLPQILSILAARNQSVLTLYWDADQVITVLLKDGHCQIAALSLAGATHQIIAQYEENLQAKSPKPEWFDPSAALGLDAAQLVEPTLLAEALQSNSLIIIPHRSLHLLPWAGLMFQGRRLFEYCPVGILPNLSCLVSLQMEWSAAPKVALFGAPDYIGLSRLATLASAESELSNTADTYAENGIVGSVFSNSEATEANFWTLARHPDAAGNVFHIACHGNFTPGDPMNAGLLLADAKIDAAEIARTPLQYEEVILSACSTGYRPTTVRGVELSGDDILGLPGAFLEAGVRSVLVSISPAKDMIATTFLAHYHDARLDGATPLAALQDTQLAMLDSPHVPPWSWISFTAYGCQ